MGVKVWSERSFILCDAICVCVCVIFTDSKKNFVAKKRGSKYQQEFGLQIEHYIKTLFWLISVKLQKKTTSLQLPKLTMIVKMLFVVSFRPLRLVRHGFRLGCGWHQFSVIATATGRTQQQRRAPKRQLQCVHPAFAGRLAGCSEYQISRGQWLHDGADRLLVGTTRRPDRLVEGMEELEAKAILFARPFNYLTRGKQDGAHPVAALGFRTFVQ